VHVREPLTLVGPGLVRTIARLLVAAALAAGAGTAPATLAAGAGRAAAAALRDGPEAGGLHRRLGTPHGPVHVWWPAATDPGTATVVVFVHGYFTSVDETWDAQGLAAQFRDSGLDALFVAPEAPWNGADPVPWPRLAPLLEEVARGLGTAPARRPLLLAGHSGAFRTLSGWLDDERVARLLLVDALYDGEPLFARWLLAGSRRAPHRMVLVALETLDRAERFVARIPGTARRSAIPGSADDLDARERGARLLFFRSQYEHMELVSGGRALPVLIRIAGQPLARAGAAGATRATGSRDRGNDPAGAGSGRDVSDAGQ
jgi:hypothetical protein